MRNLTKLTDLQLGEIYEIFNIADEISIGKYRDFLERKSKVRFYKGQL